MPSDREREEAILKALRGKARMLVSEAEFLRPASEADDWEVLRD